MHVRVLLLAVLATAAASAAVRPVVRQDNNADVNVDLRTPGPSQSAQPTTPGQTPSPLPTITPGASRPPTPSVVPPNSIAPTPSVSTTPSSQVGGAGGASPTPTPQAVTSGLTTGGIVAIVLGAIALAAFVVLLLVFVFRRGNASQGEPETGSRSVPGGGPAPGGGGEYGTPESGARSIPPPNQPVQEVELAEAEAETGYVVSDVARHHGGMAAAPVAATAAGAGAAGILAAAPPPAEEPGPTPPPHDYVVGVGQIKSQDEFEDIKTRFARDEIVDQSAVLGAAPAIEASPATTESAAPTAEVPTTAVEGATAEDTTAASAVAGTPEAPSAGPAEGDTKTASDTPAPQVEDVSKATEISGDAPSFEDRSGDVSEAARGLGVTEIIAEEAPVTPALEKDALPETTSAGGPSGDK